MQVDRRSGGAALILVERASLPDPPLDRAIQWAADNGAQVINMSLGANASCPTSTQAAADYAWSKGAVLVAAAGNSGTSGAHTPANCQNVIGVGASDPSDARAYFSNYGPEVDVGAPGVRIVSTVNPDLNYGERYAAFDGTSMAAPHVAGVAALIWATGYGTGPAAVRDRLFATADAVGALGSDWTYGRVNAASAVSGGGPAPVLTPTAGATATPTSTALPTATAMPTLPPTATPTTTPTATLATVHVGDLDGSGVRGKTSWSARVTIAVHDAGEGPVSGATVSGSWSAGASGSATCTTDATGRCSVSSSGLSLRKVDRATFSVTNVARAGSTYLASANHDPTATALARPSPSCGPEAACEGSDTKSE